MACLMRRNGLLTGGRKGVVRLVGFLGFRVVECFQELFDSLHEAFVIGFEDLVSGVGEEDFLGIW